MLKCTRFRVHLREVSMPRDSTCELRQEVESRLSRAGISVRRWALKHGFSPSLVRDVIEGKRTCRFGKSHKIAVLLGIKDGEIIDD